MLLLFLLVTRFSNTKVFQSEKPQHLHAQKKKHAEYNAPASDRSQDIFSSNRIKTGFCAGEAANGYLQNGKSN
jgi:hypothetical protein